MNPPRPLPGNRPSIEVDRTVGGATDQRRFDAPKKSTLVGMPPKGSGEFSPTIPARAYSTPTVRVTDPDKTPPSATMPTRSETAAEGVERVLRHRAEEAERRHADAEARARALARALEDRQVRSASPAPVSLPAASSAATIDDAAIGKIVKNITHTVMKKIGLPAALAAMLGLGGAGYKVATDKPSPPALTAAQLDLALDKLKTGRGGLNDLVRAQNENLQLSKCLRRKVNEIGGALLPAPDRMGSARKPQPYEDDCQESPRLLPEP